MTFALRIVTHPVVLAAAAAASVVLWMPYGFGYYDWPWRNPAARWLLQLFAIGFPLSAAYALKMCSENKAGRFRIGVVTTSLFVAIWGMWSMLTWTMHYVIPMLNSPPSIVD